MTTAGIAATKPRAVASSASAMPGATVARFVLWLAAMPIKLFMMPHTVPNRPTKGATAPMLASRPMPCAISRTCCAISCSWRKPARSFSAAAGACAWDRRCSCCTSSSSRRASAAWAPSCAFAAACCRDSDAFSKASARSASRWPLSRLAPFTSSTTQAASAAASNAISTLLTTLSAARNMPSGDRSCGRALACAAELRESSNTPQRSGRRNTSIFISAESG